VHSNTLVFSADKNFAAISAIGDGLVIYLAVSVCNSWPFRVAVERAINNFYNNNNNNRCSRHRFRLAVPHSAAAASVSRTHQPRELLGTRSRTGWFEQPQLHSVLARQSSRLRRVVKQWSHRLGLRGRAAVLHQVGGPEEWRVR